jgi:methionyl-tRNA formyltransferase
MNVIFFGSTQDSVIVCDALFTHSKKLSIIMQAVVTQPAKPIGRKHILTATPIETWAKTHAITCLTFETQKDKPWLYAHEEDVIESLSTCSPDLIISASYGQKIPEPLIAHARFGGLNVHPSLIPRWRGTDPIPWTILAGDAQTGVSIVALSKKFDEGEILAQQKIPMDDTHTVDEIRARLFTLGAALLADILPDYCSGKHIRKQQDAAHATYARRLTKDDGFVPWDTLMDAVQGKSVPEEKIPKILTDTAPASLPTSIIRAIRAFSPWPGVWSTIPIAKGETKRIKILEAHELDGKLILDTVQLEGKNPTSFVQFADAYKFTLDNLNA